MKRTEAQFGKDSAGRERAPLSEQAAHWWVVLNEEGCTAADQQAFAEWVRRSPERIEAYLRVSMLNGALHSGEFRWPQTPARALIEEALASRGEVIESGHFAPTDRHAGRQQQPSRSRWGVPMLLYGSLAAILVTALFVWTFIPSGQYSTGIGEQRSVALEDGSIVVLNTSSAVRVAYSDERRLISLTRGEALFQVAHDAARPFDVAAGNVVIRAVGTQFNVDRREDRTTVTVVEGRVAVSTERAHGAGSNEAPAEVLTALQRIVITGAQINAPEPVLNLTPVTAWTRRQLVFDDRPLEEVAEEFNRYNRQQILIESPQIKAQRVTGVFQANDSSSFLAFISGIPGVSVQSTREAHRVTIVDADNAENVGAGGGPN